MNTDKIYAKSLANEYAPKDTTKVVPLILGVGMCLSMNVIGDGSTASFVVSILSDSPFRLFLATAFCGGWNFVYVIVNIFQQPEHIDD